MICPHCDTGINESYSQLAIAFNTEKNGTRRAWSARHQRCPECGQVIIYLQGGPWAADPRGNQTLHPATESYLIWPMDGQRLCPTEVPDSLKKDFLEAAAVLPRSPQASAALSRRCLQHLLREYAKTTKKDLAQQIDELIEANSLPSSLLEQLDAVRNIGNFAAHPMKSTNSGEIIEVEPQEAEWNLDVLEELFDHYFVKPAQLQKRKESLNKKLAEAGKPPVS